ncbi:MAG: alpha/beta hydrolase, partial [Halieaceae bacterium]|nr:alpha/beta hydrolase [Halieaceae bacterium]
MSHLAREDGKQVYYEDYGSGDSAIVLVHGWGANTRAWDYTLPALVAAGHRVVLIDHRGCGQSSKDFADVSIEAISGDVVALVEHLKLSRVVLNGWSLGGAVVVAAAVALGERCSGLVLT